jgi:hypothetical protein
MPKDNSSDFKGKNILFSLAYLPPVEYFVLFNKAEKAFIEQHEFYQKQSYRNRCRIVTANGIMDLSVPVDKTGKEPIRDIRISEHTNWQTQHWRAIEAAYNSSPFFEYYSDDFRGFYEKKWVFLWDFNFGLLNKVLELLEIHKEIFLTDKYETKPDEILDVRELIHPKKNEVVSVDSYYQVFKQKFGFQSGLSILDLLFNMGNESQLFI